MSEYMKAKTEDGTGFLIETVDVEKNEYTPFQHEAPATIEPARVKYFWMLSADFLKALDEPIREYHDNGYTLKYTESGQGFMADTIEVSAETTVTRMGLLVVAIETVLKAQNERRRAAGKRLMFDESNVIVKSFDCGRNEL